MVYGLKACSCHPLKTFFSFFVGLLEANKMTNDTEATKKVKDLYASCMDLGKEDKKTCVKVVSKWIVVHYELSDNVLRWSLMMGIITVIIN